MSDLFAPPTERELKSRKENDSRRTSCQHYWRHWWKTGMLYSREEEQLDCIFCGYRVKWNDAIKEGFVNAYFKQRPLSWPDEERIRAEREEAGNL